MEEKLVTILNEMAEVLTIAQMKKLQEVLLRKLNEAETHVESTSNLEYLQMFLDAKKIEGCSERTLQYYQMTIEKLLYKIEMPIRKISTEQIRTYLSEYQQINTGAENIGHSQIDTTMQYAIVNQNNVKSSHQRYIA